MASAVRTFCDSFLRILESAVHAAVAVVVYRAVSDIISVHEVHDAHNSLRVVCRISVDLDIEDVSAACESVVWTLDLSLVLWSTFVIYRHMVRVCIVILVCHAGDDAELLLVTACETACKALCRGCEHAVVVLVCLAELVDLAAHEGHDAESELLSLC